MDMGFQLFLLSYLILSLKPITTLMCGVTDGAAPVSVIYKLVVKVTSRAPPFLRIDGAGTFAP
jgi:hypothetical protein